MTHMRQVAVSCRPKGKYILFRDPVEVGTLSYAYLSITYSFKSSCWSIPIIVVNVNLFEYKSDQPFK